MSELKALRHQLARAKAEMDAALTAAEQASDAKERFLANMSHEVRTPVTAIVGYADMMLEADQPPAVRQECLQTIRRNARHLLELVDDLLDLASLEAGRVRVEPGLCNLPHLASEVMSMMRPRAIEKNIQLELVFDGAVPRMVTTDALRLKQVLINLVGNAIKFTEVGGVVLRVACTAGADGSFLDFEISDTGIGMNQQQVDCLFKPFSQADNSFTRAFGGTGLGLAITHRSTQLLGGEISVHSALGKGTTFLVRVPAGADESSGLLTDAREAVMPPACGETAAAPVRVEGRILLAEDGEDNQRLITALLRKAGADVVVVPNGRAAVEHACAQPFDLILMDMQMPELDGYGATSELRSLGKTLPIVALTAHAMKGDREKCLRAGCTDYLAKPINKQTLLATVAGHLGSAKRAPEKLRSVYAQDADMREVVQEFVNELPNLVSELERLLAEGNLAGLRVATHQMKGAGGGYGFGPLTESAARAERSIKEGAPITDITVDVRQLIELIRRVDGFTPKQEVHGIR